MRKRLLALVVLAALAAPAAWADTAGHRLHRARTEQAGAEATLEAVQADLHRIQGRFDTAQHLLDDATIQLVEARSREREAGIRLALAEDVLTTRVRAAFESGPASTLSMFLSAQSTSDLLSINEFTSHTMQADLDAIQQVRRGRIELDRIRTALERRQAELATQQRQVNTLLEQMQARVSEAQDLAVRAGLKVKSLQEEARRIAAARARELERARLLASGPVAADQAELLALLGPNGGRGCTIPNGLRDTGRSISGDASWYGEDFAGGPTASGAPFDPSLFTAAHRTLPLGVFLRVHYRGNCAIVLVNDRGPYGNYERIIDLAQAPAEYLGVGVGHVTADVLVPR